MKIKNLTVIKKAKSKKILLKDSNTLKFYQKFRSILNKNIKNKDFAIAVSGGSDSLCLACFSKIYSTEFDNKVHVLIVDHKLRAESESEAKEVKKILKSRNITSKVLSWNGLKPKKNIHGDV